MKGVFDGLNDFENLRWMVFFKDFEMILRNWKSEVVAMMIVMYPWNWFVKWQKFGNRHKISILHYFKESMLLRKWINQISKKTDSVPWPHKLATEEVLPTAAFP